MITGKTLLTLCFCSAIITASAQDLRPPTVNPSIQPGPPHKLVRVLMAIGEQAYKCQAQPAGGFAWGPASIPSATLWDPWNYKVGEHGHNGTAPFWRLNSGGEITAKLAQGVPAPDAQSINWLLLKTEKATGGFDGVTFIQRVYTGGGAAPKHGCDSGSAGKVAKIGYTAAYYFWK